MIKQDKKLQELYGSKFTIEVNSGKTNYRHGIIARTDGFSVKSIVDGKVVKEIEKIALVQGYIQEDSGGIQKYESLGDLICVPLYEAEYDDEDNRHWFEDNGFVILDKDLNVVYKSDKKDLKRLGRVRNQNAILQMVSKYGPCALAHAYNSVLEDEKFIESLDKTFKERIKILKDKKESQDNINLEIKQFTSTKEYLEEQAKEKSPILSL